MDTRTPFNESSVAANGKSAADKAESVAANGKSAADKAEIKAEKAELKAANTDVSLALQQMKDAASSVYQALNSIGLASTDLAKQKVGKGKESAKQIETTAEEYLRERPLAAVGIAFVAGWAISKLLQGNSRH